MTINMLKKRLALLDGNALGKTGVLSSTDFPTTGEFDLYLAELRKVLFPTRTDKQQAINEVLKSKMTPISAATWLLNSPMETLEYLATTDSKLLSSFYQSLKEYKELECLYIGFDFLREHTNPNGHKLFYALWAQIYMHTISSSTSELEKRKFLLNATLGSLMRVFQNRSVDPSKFFHHYGWYEKYLSVTDRTLTVSTFWIALAKALSFATQKESLAWICTISEESLKGMTHPIFLSYFSSENKHLGKQYLERIKWDQPLKPQFEAFLRAWDTAVKVHDLPSIQMMKERQALVNNPYGFTVPATEHFDRSPKEQRFAERMAKLKKEMGQ